MNRLLLILLASLCWMGTAVLAADPPARFPRPDFESGYTPPPTQCPLPRADVFLWVDVVVLAGSMALAAWLVLRRRSRKGIVLLLVFSIAYFGFYRKGCVCPVGSLQNMALALSGHGYAMPWVIILFFFLPLVFALFLGRVFCSAICPLGAIQDIVIRKPVRLPAFLAELLGFLPVYFLGSSLLLAAGGAGFVICAHDPFVGFYRLGAPLAMLITGGVMLAVGVFVARPYCRFFCAYGILLGWMSRLSARHARITPDRCISCRLCEKVCPFDCIQAPLPVKGPEPVAKTRRRFGLIIAGVPVVIALGIWVGMALSPVFARMHPVVRLADRLSREERGMVVGLSLESEAARMSGQLLSGWMRQAEERKQWFRSGSAVMGGFLGVVFALRMIRLSRVRVRTEYEIDRERCFSCGRCFESCPVDRAWRGGRNTSELKL